MAVPVTLPPEALEPLHAEARVHAIGRPSLSYWQDAWRRLKANRRAIVSLYIVVAMLAFTLFGPLVWRVDPSAQDLLQVSSPPGTARGAVIVPAYAPWSDAEAVPAVVGLQMAGPATTQQVRLVWQRLPGAVGYRVYRNIIPVGEGEALGLPLVTTGPDEPTRYEDRLDLRPGTSYYSIVIGLVAPLLYVLLGVVYGSVAGFIGGRTDQVMMRFADFVIALPFLLFMILFKIAFGIGPGESGIVPMIVALVVLSWPGTARLVRGQILQVREEAYIGAARLLGAPTGYLVLRHMIPNTMGVILVTLTFAIPGAIFTEAFLSFIGLGVAPPNASWGSMSNDGVKTMLSHPHELLFPALMISITVLAFNLLGDGLRDALDARMRSRD